MILPFTQTKVVDQTLTRTLFWHVAACLIGLAFGYLFSTIWPAFTGLAALALWPLGIALGLVSTTLLVSLVTRQTFWELLITGKVLVFIGAGMLFFASL